MLISSELNLEDTIKVNWDPFNQQILDIVKWDFYCFMLYANTRPFSNFNCY